MSNPSATPSPKQLTVFLCHASEDKPFVRPLYHRLQADGFAPWLDEVDILPGQEWDPAIRAAVRAADVVAVCISRTSVGKAGYLQKEISFALDVAEEKPPGTIFIIPVRRDDVEIPERLRKWQAANMLDVNGYDRLLHTLKLRAHNLSISVTPVPEPPVLVSPASPFRILTVEHITRGIFEELREVQHASGGYLPAAALEEIAARRNLLLSDVLEIVKYYSQFHLQKPARVAVRICDDLSCHLRGASELRRKLERAFTHAPKSDLSISSLSCLGRCDQAPAFAINDFYYGGLASGPNGDGVERAIEEVREVLEGRTPQAKSYLSFASRPLQELKSDPYGGQKPYSALKRVLQSRAWDGLIDELRRAELRGMGGAGFPTHMKWRRVREASASEKYVVCNASGSEPGSTKDRFILTHLPHLVLEGMILAGICVGAKRGYLFIRHEYQEQVEILRKELQRCQERGIVGEHVFGADLHFEIEIFVSPGGYICGEESALMEAIEGKRAQPRHRPPLMSEVGLWGKPTLGNNVETMAFAAAIAAKGADWFNSYGGAIWLDKQGRSRVSKGLKFVGISGDVQKPGVYEVPFGTTYRNLIYEHAGGLLPGRDLIAFAPSGPSSGFLPPSEIDLPLDWQALQDKGSMLGSCAVVICGKGRCMLDMAFNAIRFYRNESCGKCMPCRAGSQKMTEILERWTMGQGNLYADQEALEQLSQAVPMASICGLGRTLPAPILSLLKYFPDEVDEHLVHRRCPAGVCFRPSGSMQADSIEVSISVEVSIDGQRVRVAPGTTILEAARQIEIDIPAPCYREDEPPAGTCRVCVIDTSEQTCPAACMRRVEKRSSKTNPQDPDLIVRTDTERVMAARRTFLRLMLEGHPVPCERQRQSGDCELERLAREYGIAKQAGPN